MLKFSLQKYVKIFNSIFMIFAAFLLAHLSQRHIGIVYPCPVVRLSVVARRPSVFHNFKHLLQTTCPIKAKFYVEPPWVGGTKVCSRHLGHMTKVKTLQKSSSPEPMDRFPRNLVCSIGDSSPSLFVQMTTLG